VTELLKTTLDRLYADFNYPDSATDPIQIVRRYPRPDDREVVGFFASALAFGRVASVLQSIERLLAVVGDRPAEYVRRFDPAREKRAFAHLVHRWIGGADLVALLWIVRQMIERAGSIEGFFLEGDDPGTPDITSALDSFSTRALALDLTAAYGPITRHGPPGKPVKKTTVNAEAAETAEKVLLGFSANSARSALKRRHLFTDSEGGPRVPGVCYFLPRPSAGSACKRLNLFLRWMTRHDALDLGVWSRVSPARLVVPLDTHVIRVGRCLRLTRYTSPGWPMARDITRTLSRLDPDDPVKYDFALCHLGMMNACGFNRAQADAQCPLRGVCRPRVRTHRRSRPPSARR
jgi:uncharacterized protein (TIGR02757 family)